MGATDPRRLTAEMRESLKDRLRDMAYRIALDPTSQGKDGETCDLAFDALHDLDVLEGELAAERDKTTEALKAAGDLRMDLAAAQATIQRQGAVIAEMWTALANISANTCCNSCREAAIVAQTVLNKSTAQLAADHDAAVRAEERRRVLRDVHDQWVTQSSEDWARWLDLELAAQPEESTND